MPTRLHIQRPFDFVEFSRANVFQGIHQRIEDQARLYPRNIALKTRDASYTYAEMNGLANSLAETVLSVGGTALGQAAILLPNAPEMIVAILGALKAHKAYVPLDPQFPKERLKAMVEDSEAGIVLTDSRHMALAEELTGGWLRIVNISEAKLRADAANPNAPCDPLDRAYILYTSGSTGRPKGIAFLHRNLLHTTMCLTNELFFSPSDRVTWLHSASFAASVVDIYCGLMNGAALYPWEAKRQGFIGLAEWLTSERATTFQWIPSAFRQFLRTVPENYLFSDIRIVVMASEPLTIREVELFRRHFLPGSHLVNQVGTSESYNYRLYPVDHAIPIENANVAGGYAVSEDREVVILDEDHRPMPQGGVGEIGVRSDYMSAGYWRDDALTAAKFIRIGGEDKTPVYLTGDSGRLEADGCLIHLGRKDFQVKIRGYRVELAEVEHALAAAPGVADAVAWVMKNRLGDDQLVGYLIPKEEAPFALHAVERYMESRLPDYMTPNRYVILAALPKLSTGKIDRNALPNPFEGAAPPSGALAVAEPAVEREIVALFRDLLQREDLGPPADFLQSGGDSLLTALLLHRINQRFGVEVEVDVFLEAPVAASLAAQIASALNSGMRRVSSNAPAAKPSPARELSGRPRPAVFAPHARQVLKPSDWHREAGDLIIISAGRLGRETFGWAKQAIAAGYPWRIKGFLDNRANLLDGYGYEPGIVGDVETYCIQKDDVFIGAVGDPVDKRKYYTPILERGGRFVNLIHPQANIGEHVRLGYGIIMAPFVAVTSDATVGDHVVIGGFSNVGHDAVVGDWCQISSHCGVNGQACLEEGVFLGSHACVIPEVEVGAWAFVGAGSVVVRDVPPRVKVFGNPAAPIGRQP